MTLQELYTFMNSINLPSTYYAFPEGEVPDPPYFVFYYPTSDNFGADNKTYQVILDVKIELYTKYRSFEDEATIESALDSKHIYWDKISTYISSEDLFQTFYEMEILINAQ